MPAFEAASPLLVMIVFFGQLPPWLPLTLHSMAANERVRFVVVSDAVPPAVLPPNVAFEHITYEAMQARLSGMTGMQVAYPNTYKANDIKPLLPALYPKLVEGYRWWAWADLDVVFGDLMRYFQLAEPHPACCKGLELTCNKKARRDRRSPCFNSTRPRAAADTYWDKRACPCTNSETVTAISPLYPNPWRKKCWGPFTAFRTDVGAELFRRTPRWRELLSNPAYAHFDEWWGPFAGKGYETMGEVMSRLSDDGELVRVSAAPSGRPAHDRAAAALAPAGRMPARPHFLERASSGRSPTCWASPPRPQVMSKASLPFAEAKSCSDVECTFCPCGATRLRYEAGRLYVNDQETMVLHLAESKSRWFRHAAAVAAALPPYVPSQISSICYVADGLGALSPDPGLPQAGDVPRAATRYSRHRPSSSKAAAAIEYGETVAEVPLAVSSCARVASPPPPPLDALSSVVSSHGELRERYAAYTAAERERTMQWLCAWAQLSSLYYDQLMPRAAALPRSSLSKQLPGAHGNRRVRTPLYGGERVGWWRRTVNVSVNAAGRVQIDPAGVCRPIPLPCEAHADASTRRSGGASKRKRRARAEDGGARRARGRRLRGPARYDMNTPAVPGVPCLKPLPPSVELPAVQESIFDGYLHHQHALRAELGRLQRWRCSWLYLFRACLDAEAALGTQGSSCRKVRPPFHDGAMGWGGKDPTTVTEGKGVAQWLFQFRCW